MDDGQELDTRLQNSAKTLRAWRWMSRISSDREEVAALLTAEARELIALGRAHPTRAKDIGKHIVAYHKLIMEMREGQTCPNAAGANAA